MITLFGKNMCESCFAENDKDPCEKCGFSSADYQQDSTALPIGQKLQERYLIGGIIGKGGFGITYAAFDTKLERRVAVKEYYPYGIASRTPGTTMVSSSSSSDAEDGDVFSKGAEKFYDEARLVAKFSDNQNIVSIYDFFYENSTVYYVMEYLQGQSMKKYIAKHGVVSAEQAVYIAKEISNALVSSHSANVLHRDIAPDNIMLCNNGKVKLIDFGAARQVISEGSQSLSVILKQGFAPLEQYQKKGKQGPWTDIYALGATIYYLTTGDLLDDPMTRMDDDDEFSSNMYNINEELWNVIKKATMLKPADRYKNIFEFRDDLNNIGIGSVPLTISYDAPSGSGADVPVSATMPAKEASPVGATMPAKEASPVGATMPAKEASPVGATMPVKEASPIGATMPAKEASPIGATMPAKEASPIGATMPAKEAAPIGATMPVKEQPSQKSGIFTETDADDDKKSYQSAAAVAEQLSKKKKMGLIIGLSICVIAIIIFMCVYSSTHVKIGYAWYDYSDGFVYVQRKEITDLSKLAEKTSIRSIRFDMCTFPDPSVLEELKNMENLHTLQITDSSSFSNISALKDMTGLNNLNLNDNKISDISALSGLTNLKVLYLGDNNISDISALKDMTELTELGISYNKISDISALSGLTNLEELYMFTSKDSKITDLSPLKKLTNLETLCLTYNGENYHFYSSAEIKDFLNKNVKTTAAAAEPKEEKPEKQEQQKPEKQEQQKPDSQEQQKPENQEQQKPEKQEQQKPENQEQPKPESQETEPQKLASTYENFEKHVENQSKAYKEQLASIDDAIGYYITEMDGNGDPTYDIGNNYYEMIVMAGSDEISDVRYEFYRYDDYRQTAIYMGQINASHSFLVWDRNNGMCLCTAWMGYIDEYRILLDGNKVTLEKDPVLSVTMDEEFDVYFYDMTPKDDLSLLTVKNLSDYGLE